MLCYKTAKAACTAKYLTAFKEGGMPKGTERMLLLLEVGCAGEGTDSILASGASGQLYISQATPIKLCPLPAAAIASTQPRTCLCHLADSYVALPTAFAALMHVASPQPHPPIVCRFGLLAPKRRQIHARARGSTRACACARASDRRLKHRQESAVSRVLAQATQ